MKICKIGKDLSLQAAARPSNTISGWPVAGQMLSPVQGVCYLKLYLVCLRPAKCYHAFGVSALEISLNV